MAFQEVDMSASAMLKEETEAAAPWVAACNAAVGADMDASPSSPMPYYALKPKQLVGLLLCVYIRRGLLPQLKEFLVTTIATGALGSLGNKGAVGIHLSVHRSTYCIITAHLAAGQSNVSKRNEDINTILKNMDFNAARRADLQLNSSAGIVPEMVFPELFPRDHDFIIVAGDLNYRLNLSYEECMAKCGRGDIEDMLKYDQLVAEMKNPHTPWQGFEDLTPTHMPTYRFDMGTDNYDTSEKRRIPSFTDRVLIWSRRLKWQKAVKVKEHVAIMQVRSSDHKPVRLLLDIPAQVEVPSKKEVTTSLKKKVTQLGMDNASSAKVSTDVTLLDFGVLQFHRCDTVRTAKVTNTGDSVAVVKVLRQRPGQDQPVNDGAWMRVSPMEFSILPGESQDIVIETLIDPRCMPWLARWRPYDARGRVALAASLLVVVRSGPMHIIDCQAVLVPSIYGNSLENVLLLGSLPCVDAYQAKVDHAVLLNTLQPQIPKELWFLVDAVTKQPLEKGYFTASSIDTDTSHAVMAYIDSTAAPLPAPHEPGAFDVLCVADCILVFLQNLQEPVVPFALYDAALAAGKAKGKAPLAFLAQLPAIRANLFVYLMSFLNFLLRQQHAENDLTAPLLAHVFSVVLIRRPTSAEGLSSARLLQGGGVDQQVRQQLQNEKEDAKALVEFFLTASPVYLQ
ncbi:phosphatidylinositol-bisphosphatase [Angomonas deanei]|nr:phosphatidylinositol-bisphosphatase [Angomonas deanei]|eukprot:EPY26489.1 phosphatidylinositol-bisphosphatase [Angomonas deanei]